MSATELAMNASKCLEAWSSGDLETTRALLADDVIFTGPMGHTVGADDYVSGVAGLADNVTRVELKKLIVEGDDVCIMYDLFSKQAGALPTVGWYHFADDDRIDSVQAYFDPRPFTEALATRPLNAQQAGPGVNVPLFAASLQVSHEPTD
jgi:ketosteroid isomerase-like protein